MSDPVPFARGGAYPPRAGNEARPLVDGERAFRRIAAAVRAARASVWVTVAFVERQHDQHTTARRLLHLMLWAGPPAGVGEAAPS